MSSSKDRMKILVIGLGPIGGIFASHMASTGHEVHGVDIWQEHIEKISESGLSIEGFLSLNKKLGGVYPKIEGAAGINFDYVVISVKTPAMPSVVPQVARLGEGFQVVSLQNGLDTEEYIAETFPRERVMRVSVNYAGNIAGPGRIHMTWFNKPNYLGCLCGKGDCRYTRALASALTSAQLDTLPVEDIKRHTLEKTILNAILAPISAILGMTMGEVQQEEETYRLVKLLLRECIEVSKKMGYDFGEGFFDTCLGYLSKGGSHKPSMLIDIESGHKTEIDYINGKIVSYGERFGVAVPVNVTIAALVKAREKMKRGELVSR